jgi:O-antigen ligase
MIDSLRLRDLFADRTARTWLVAALVLLAAAVLGSRASVTMLLLPCAVLALAVVALHPILGLVATIVTALLIPFELGTGREVSLNLSTLLVPATFALWFIIMVRRQDLRLPRSRTTLPLLFFVLASLLSLLIGTAYWDPAVPRPGNILLVQFAQWGIFLFSALAFWLTASLVHDEVWLRRLTFLYLVLAGSLAILRVLPGMEPVRVVVATFAFERSPFWLLLAAVAAGQLLFNQTLSLRWRVFLCVALGAVMVFAFIIERKTLSHLVGVALALGVLAWLRWPRWRWAYVALALLAVTLYSATIFEFAGGDAEWDESGGSRLALSGRVIEVTMRNPITGLGPAAYRAYARVKPLFYQRAYWIDPQVNSHNNYVDLFSQGGILGLALFLWFSVEVFRLGRRLRTRFVDGFAAGYVSAMLAAWVGALALMVFADWILPFVYNIGFPGFQASVLVWLFLGGLVALEQMAPDEIGELQAP